MIDGWDRPCWDENIHVRYINCNIAASVFVFGWMLSYQDVQLYSATRTKADNGGSSRSIKPQVCKTFKRVQTNSMKMCGLRFMKVGKSHVTWLFRLIVWGLCLMVLFCTAAIALWWSMMEPKRPCLIKQSISEGTYDPWKDRVSVHESPT